MKPPCDQAVIETGAAINPCATAAEPWILAVTILGSSMAFIDSTVVNIALPSIQSSLGGTVTDMQWVVEAYALLLSALILTGGALGDVFGRKRMFLLGVIVFAIASVGCGLAANIRGLVIARSVQGLGAAFLVPGSLSIISASFSESKRGRAIGTWSGFTSITAATGPILGGWLIENASWRWAFFLNVPIAFAVVALSLWRVPESKARDEAPRRLAWRNFGNGRINRNDLRIYRVLLQGMERFPDLGRIGGGSSMSRLLPLLRGARQRSDGSLRAVSVYGFQRSQLADFFSLCSSGNLLFSIPAEPDPSAGLFGDSHGSCGPSIHPVDVSAFPLVRRPCRSFWRKAPAHRRSNHRGHRISLFRSLHLWAAAIGEHFSPDLSCSASEWP